MCAVTVCWFVALAVLAWRTANPVVLNAEQIQRADLVVTGVPREGGVVIVDREWKQGRDLGSIPVKNLAGTPAEPGSRYIIPLTADGESQYRVTPSRLAGQRPLVYPATSDALEQLAKLIGR